MEVNRAMTHLMADRTLPELKQLIRQGTLRQLLAKEYLATSAASVSLESVTASELVTEDEIKTTAAATKWAKLTEPERTSLLQTLLAIPQGQGDDEAFEEAMRLRMPL